MYRYKIAWHIKLDENLLAERSPMQIFCNSSHNLPTACILLFTSLLAQPFDRIQAWMPSRVRDTMRRATHPALIIITMACNKYNSAQTPAPEAQQT